MTDTTLDHITVHLSQEGNTLGTTTEYETVQLDVETQLGCITNGDTCFYVLRTEGWSFDSLEDLRTMLNKALPERAKL